MATIQPTHTIYTTSASLSSSQSKILDRKMMRDNQIIASNGTNVPYSEAYDPGALISAQKKISALNSQEKQDTLLLMRNKRMEAQITDVQRVGSDLQKHLMSANTKSSMSPSAFANTAQNLLDQMEAIMNNGFGCDQTLGGTSTKDNAVNFKNLVPINAEDPIKTDYYKGADGNILINLDNETIVDVLPITGKNDAFAKIIQSARLCLNVDPNDPTTPAYVKAKTLCQQALTEDIPNAIYKVGNERIKIQKTIDSIPERLQSEVEKYDLFGVENYIDSLISIQNTQASKDITINLSIRQTQAKNKLADELMRSMA